MQQHQPGLLVMIYGLKIDVELNGKMVTIKNACPADFLKFILNNTQYPKDQMWWECDDGFMYMTKNLLPIGNTDPDLEISKEDIKITQY